MKVSITNIVTMVAAAYVGVAVFLYLAQRSFLYYPVPAASGTPAEDLRWDVGGETLQIWRIGAEAEDAVIYYGGNAEDVSFNVGQFARIFVGKAVYLVNYRGYGASSGSPTQTALFADATALYDRIARAHRRVTVVGRSLGSGVAIHLAAERRPERVLLITPFASITGVAQAALPFFPVSLLLKDRFDSESYASQVTAPVLMLIAEHDKVIPRWSSDRLAEALNPERLTVEVVLGTGHNTIHLAPHFETALAGFLGCTDD
jgi:hypothetical protein